MSSQETKNVSSELPAEQIEYCMLTWDYYGPSAEGTARHFHHHLDEWLKREGLTDRVRETWVEQSTEMHYFAACVIAFSDGERVYRALKAHRAVKVAPS